jgi:hypothetical protein
MAACSKNLLCAADSVCTIAVLHQLYELDRVATGAAREAVEDALLDRDGHGRTAFAVDRAADQLVAPAALVEVHAVVGETGVSGSPEPSARRRVEGPYAPIASPPAFRRSFMSAAQDVPGDVRLPALGNGLVVHADDQKVHCGIRVPPP